MPGSQASSVTFGGPDFTEMFVTSAAKADSLYLAPKAPRAPLYGATPEFGAYLARSICTECHGAEVQKHNLRLGSRVAVTFPNGNTRQFVIKGVFDPPSGGTPFGPVTISAAAWDAQVPSPENLYSFVKTSGGTTAANQAALEKALKPFPNAKAQTRKKFISSQIGPFKQILNVLYVLLALSVIVSLFGIVNTLVLTVFERTREIGMLRAIGMTRRQVRRMIRHESIITSLIGASIGIALGLLLATLLIVRVDFLVFSFPTTQVLVFFVAAILVGILAAIFPARRAARLNPLEAIAYE